MGEASPRTPLAVRAAALVAAEVALVITLHWLGRWPWMRVDWADLGGWLGSPAEDVLLGTTRTAALVLSWWLLLSTLAYLLATVRRAPAALRSVRWALFPGVRQLLDSVLALSIVGGATVAQAPGALAAPAAVAEPHHVRAPARPAAVTGLRVAVYRATEALPGPVPTSRPYTVQAGDSLWEIAEARLGDGARWEEVWDLNRDRLEAAGADGPNTLMVGWTIELPADVPTDVPTGAVPVAAGHVVRPGETLSSIATDELGDPARHAELFDRNRGRPQPGGGALTDPDVIAPGWVIELPPVAPPAEAPATPETPPGPGDTSNDRDSGPTTNPTQPSAPTSPTTESSRQPANSTTTDSPGEPANSTTTAPARPAGDPRPSTPQVDADDGTDAIPFLLGLSGATVLATGILVHLRRAQQRRLARGGARALWRPRGRASAGVATAMVRAADLPLVRWAGQELAMALSEVDPRRLDGATPVAVELSDEGIEVLWDAPAPHAPGGWDATDGGWAWHRAYDPDAETPPDALCAPLPALVTIGERNGRQLLLDLEAYGALAVTGDPDRVAAFGRAVAAELGADEDFADAYVSTVGFGLGIDDHLRRIRRTTATEALHDVQQAVQQAEAILEQGQVTSTFEHRTGPGGVHLEAIVAVVAGDQELTELAATPPRRGAAAILLGADGPAPATLHVHSDGTADFHALGLTLTAAGITEDDVERVASVLEEHEDLDGIVDVDVALDPFSLRGLAEPEPAPPGEDDTRDDPAPPTAARDQHEDEGQDQPVLAGHSPDTPDERDDATDDRLVVRVLGKPRLDGYPDLGRKELALVVYLACHGNDVDPARVVHAVWGGKAVEGKTLWNIASRTRRALGDFPDGTPVFPAANRRTNTLHLDPRVTTDLALLQSAHDDALDAPTSEATRLLREALARVEGPPFDAPGYEWATHDELWVADASNLVESAAERLVQLATESGDLDLARWAAIRGLRGLPGNEVLYRARMRVEHAAGSYTALRAAWDELNAHLLGLETDPADATRHLYDELLPPTRRRRPA